MEHNEEGSDWNRTKKRRFIRNCSLNDRLAKRKTYSYYRLFIKPLTNLLQLIQFIFSRLAKQLIGWSVYTYNSNLIIFDWKVIEIDTFI